MKKSPPPSCKRCALNAFRTKGGISLRGYGVVALVVSAHLGLLAGLSTPKLTKYVEAKHDAAKPLETKPLEAVTQVTRVITTPMLAISQAKTVAAPKPVVATKSSEPPALVPKPAAAPKPAVAAKAIEVPAIVPKPAAAPRPTDTPKSDVVKQVATSPVIATVRQGTTASNNPNYNHSKTKNSIQNTANTTKLSLKQGKTGQISPSPSDLAAAGMAAVQPNDRDHAKTGNPEQSSKAQQAEKTASSAPQPRVAESRAAHCANNPKPVYPSKSRELGEEGQVLLEVRIAKSGKVESAAVLRSSGYARLDQASERAVLAWVCQAAVAEGEPLSTLLKQTIRFSLDDEV